MPPITTAANASNIMPTPKFAVAPAVRAASNHPANAESNPDITKAQTATLTTGIPARKGRDSIPAEEVQIPSKRGLSQNRREYDEYGNRNDDQPWHPKNAEGCNCSQVGVQPEYAFAAVKGDDGSAKEYIGRESCDKRGDAHTKNQQGVE
jgi:hypothetical protein